MKLSSVSVLKLTNPNFGRSASSNNRSDKRSHKMKHKAFNNLTLHVNEPHNNSDQNKLINSEQLGNTPIRANENILHDAQVATNNRRSQILFTITFQFTKKPCCGHVRVPWWKLWVQANHYRLSKDWSIYTRHTNNNANCDNMLQVIT